MSRLTELRWHARGGQGAKTASTLLAEALSEAGMYVQGFPEYGPERMGAPILAFNRISDVPIDVHCHVTAPQVVLVLDPTLMGKIDVTAGMTDNGILLVNTNEPAGEIKQKLDTKAISVYTVDATQIALDTIGKAIPNTPMIGALVKTLDFVDFDEFLPYVTELLRKKFGKEEIVKGNVEAIKRAYQEVETE